LKSGDQVEVITSSKQTPKEDWLGYVVTARAKAKIKNALKEEKKKKAEDGREILERKFNHLKIDFTVQNINHFATYLKLPSAQELFFRVAMGMLDLKLVKNFLRDKDKKPVKGHQKEVPAPSLEQMVTNVRGKSDMLILGENLDKIDYKLSPCCTPIPGDDVFGFITINEGIKIHRVNCPNALQLMSNYAYRVVKAKWSQELLSFLAGIKVSGIDEMGIVNNITKVISNELNVNMRSISFDTNDGTFEGTIMVFVHDTKHLTDLMNKLKKVPGVLQVKRIDSKKQEAK
jgi:guanosine-3',5'-bis(diphosphate) 3'-pyrophosphohydrolase